MIDEIKNFERALKHGDSQKIKEILSKNPKEYNALLFKETNALLIACGNGYFECVKLLIEFGAKINKTKYDECSPLHLACNAAPWKDTEACIRLLVKHGANINARDAHGKTPLHHAYENPKILRVLLELGADTRIQNGRGHTP